MGSEAKARVGLWFMLAAALFSFNQLFATGDYPGPAILGMLIATGIAVGARRLGLSTPLTFLISLAALSWYLSLVFHARLTLWSLPTPDSLNALWRSLNRAYEHSQIDYAPIPIRPGYAVMIVAALWVATTVGEIATFRWRRPLIASLLPIVVFAFAMTLGTGMGGPAFVVLFLTAILTYWGLESAHRLRSWGRWVSAWSHHRDAEPESLIGDLARRVGAAAVMAAVISPLFLPALNEGILHWRSGIGPGSGEGGSGRINPWVSIVPDLPNQTDAELFEVESRAAAYWRIASLEIFDGTNWREAERTRVPAEGGSIGGPGIAVTASEALLQTYSITGLRGEFLPAAVSPTQAARLDVEGIESVAGIDYDPDSGAILVDDDLERGNVYQVSSNVPAIQYTDIVDAEPARSGEIDDVYFQLPQRLPVEVDVLIEEWTRNAESPFEKLVAIQERLRSFDYNLQPPQPQGESLVADFLLNTRQGFCQHFATAFAAIARQMDYPARVSVGFLPGEKDQLSDVYSVRGTDAHAWPEVYFAGYGWIAFEPTPRSESVAPRYTLEPVFSGGNGERGTADPGSDPLSDIPGAGQGGVAFDEVGGTGDEAFPGLTDGRARELFLQGQSEGRRGRAQWEKTFARVVIVSASALLGFLLFVPAFKEMRIRRRYARAMDPNSIAAAAFTQFSDEAAELAESRRNSESALSYAIRMATARRVAGRTALRLAQIYEAAAYSSNAITAEQAEEARKLAQALRRQLWHQASWWSRAGRLFSPKGLTARA